MSQLLKVQLEDEDGNIYYLHTSGDSVFLDDGRTVQAAIEQTVRQSAISNVQVNDSSKVPSAALAYAMQQQITENEEAITGLNSDLGEKLQKYTAFMNEGHTALNISFTTENGLMGAFLYSPAAFVAVSVDLLKAKQIQGSLQTDPVKINVLTGTLYTNDITAQIEYNGDNWYRLKFLFPSQIGVLYFVPIITQFNNPNFSSAAS